MSREARDVTRGLTLRGAQLCEAILRGLKNCENRSWTLQPGWSRACFFNDVHSEKKSFQNGVR